MRRSFILCIVYRIVRINSHSPTTCRLDIFTIRLCAIYTALVFLTYRPNLPPLDPTGEQDGGMPNKAAISDTINFHSWMQAAASVPRNHHHPTYMHRNYCKHRLRYIRMISVLSSCYILRVLSKSPAGNLPG